MPEHTPAEQHGIEAASAARTGEVSRDATLDGLASLLLDAKAENRALKASLNAMFEQAVELHANPSPLGTFADTLGYRLGTAGHLYTCEGYVAVMAERDEARGAADALAHDIANALDAFWRDHGRAT